MALNKAMLIGNLGQKPVLKYLPSGQAVCTFSVATNEKYTDKNDVKQEKVEWHSIVVWGKTAENCAKYLDKGRAVYIEGRLQTRSWDDKNDGKKRYRTEINAQTVQFLGGGGGGKRDDAPPPGEDDASDGDSSQGSGPPPDGDDDIPF